MKAIVIGAAHNVSIGKAVVDAMQGHSLDVIAPTHNDLDVRSDCRGYMRKHSDADILVLSHGVSSVSPFEEQSLSEVYHVIETNVIGTILAAQAFVRATITRRARKSIFIIGSLGGSRVFTNGSTYCASKAAVAHLGRCMAWELTPKGFDVYVIEPGNVSNTPLSNYVKSHMANPESYDKNTNRGSIITAEEVASVIVRIIINKMVWLSGEPIRLSGGSR